MQPQECASLERGRAQGPKAGNLLYKAAWSCQQDSRSKVLKPSSRLIDETPADWIQYRSEMPHLALITLTLELMLMLLCFWPSPGIADRMCGGPTNSDAECTLTNYGRSDSMLFITSEDIISAFNSAKATMALSKTLAGCGSVDPASRYNGGTWNVSTPDAVMPFYAIGPGSAQAQVTGWCDGEFWIMCDVHLFGYDCTCN